MKLVALAALACGGCSLITDSFVTNEFSGDQFPIDVDLSSGAVMMGLRQSGVPDRAAVLDVLSPVTLVDPGASSSASVSTADVLLLGANGRGGPIEQPRARLQGAQLISLHPCESEDCVVGAAAAAVPYTSVIGADVLAGDALRLRLGASQVFLLPDIGGDEAGRTYACDAVFPSPYHGGGTLLIAGTELPFGGRRIAIDACLGANPDPMLPQSRRGADVLLVASTGIGVSILGETAYAKYVEANPAALPLAALPPGAVNLPSGLVMGHMATLSSLALVATSSSTPRAPCREVYGSHLLIRRDCEVTDDCPCENGDVFCSMPAVLELASPTNLDVLVVVDSDPTLQALRTELRPDQPEVDGILGTNAMQSAELDIDYPHNRVLARCSGDGCVTRPELTSVGARTQIQGCLGPNPVGPIF
jgi:hypothetical protein